MLSFKYIVYGKEWMIMDVRRVFVVIFPFNPSNKALDFTAILSYCFCSDCDWRKPDDDITLTSVPDPSSSKRRRVAVLSPS